MDAQEKYLHGQDLFEEEEWGEGEAWGGLEEAWEELWTQS